MARERADENEERQLLSMTPGNYHNTPSTEHRHGPFNFYGGHLPSDAVSGIIVITLASA